MRSATRSSGCASSLAAAALVAACGGEPPCGPREDGSVVACLDDTAITAAEVAELVRSPEPVAGRAEPPDPRRRALDVAIRVRLFVEESVARGLAVPFDRHRRSTLYHALVRDEAARVGAVPERIGDDEARRYYETHLGELNPIDAIDVRVIVVSDAASAEVLYAEVAGDDDAAFAEAARYASEDPSADLGGWIGDAHGERVDPAVTRVADELRARGDVGGPVRLADGRYAIVQAAEVRIAARPYDEAMAWTVKELLAERRRQAALDALEGRLRAARTIEVFGEALARVEAR